MGVSLQVVRGNAMATQLQLYTSLAQLSEGKSEEIVRNCEHYEFREFEAWRR